MVPRRGFRCMFVLFAVLSSWATVASGQKPAFVIGEKLSGSVGFYDADGKRLSCAKVGSHPHEIVLSPDERTLYVADKRSGVDDRNEQGREHRVDRGYSEPQDRRQDRLGSVPPSTRDHIRHPAKPPVGNHRESVVASFDRPFYPKNCAQV